ncbi:MAG: hypothetical protein GQ533_10730 [Methanosarcinaceae archaeon]|nr:hypothetical protein [Methanosarcinaceae archaeon]
MLLHLYKYVAFYWKNKKETDIVLRTKEDLFAVEVKYQEKICFQNTPAEYKIKLFFFNIV